MSKLKEISGSKSKQVPVDQSPDESQRSQGDQGVVDAPPCAPEAPPPCQDGTDDNTNGQDCTDERQRKQRCEQGRHIMHDDQITGGGHQPDQEEHQPDQEEHIERTEHTGQPACERYLQDPCQNRQ